MEIEYDEDGNVIGTNNSRRLNRLQAIADKADQDADHKDLEPYIPEDPANKNNPEPDEQTEEVPEVFAEAPEVVQAPRKFKLKVNGQEIEVSEQELIERAQKVEAADRYLQEASDQRRRAQEESQRVRPLTDEIDDDDLALANALQLGSTEEAAKVIRRLKGQSLNPEQVIEAAVVRVGQRSDATWFRETYQDVFSDEFTARLAMDLDKEQLDGGDSRPPRVRYTEIGNKLRTWRGTTPTLQTKVDAKRSAPAAIKPAAVRNTTPKEDEDTSQEQDQREALQQIARSRGQERPH